MVAVDTRPPASKFLWVSSGEPHAIRRRELLAKYGDKIRKLYGYDHATAWQVVGVVFAQFVMAYLVRDWAWWKLWIAAYVISGTLNQNLFCAQHEISHFLAFRKPSYNKLLALFGNLPLVVPVAVKFREYHHDHHIFLGVDGGDVDLPTVFESSWIVGFFSKVFFTFIYLAIYAVRPLLVRPKAPTMADLVNWVLVIGVDVGVLYFLGIKSLVYLLAGSLLGGGLHPMAGHLIAEHYMFAKGQETYSYYGPLNALSYNVGYHNEHHDFPQIPQTRLHKLRQIAPEYYNTLYAHTSWCWVLWRFLVDPSMGPWSRMHRVIREGTPAGNTKFVSSRCSTAALSTPQDAARSAEVRVVVLEVPIPVLKGQQVTIHAHTARESGHISGLVSLLNAKTGEVQRARPRCLLKGQTAVVEVTPARPMCMEEYAAYRALGRVALRDCGRTIAVGIVSSISDS